MKDDRFWNSLDKNITKQRLKGWQSKTVDVFDDFYNENQNLFLIETSDPLQGFTKIHSRLKFIKNGEKRNNSKYNHWYLYEKKELLK